jgi:hypothetical protein
VPICALLTTRLKKKPKPFFQGWNSTFILLMFDNLLQCFFEENMVGALPFIIVGEQKSLYRPGRTRQRSIRLYIRIPPLYMHGQCLDASLSTCWLQTFKTFRIYNLLHVEISFSRIQVMVAVLDIICY